MIETKTKTIAGVEYQTTQFPGRASFRIKAKLVKLLGPSILTALNGDRKPAPTGKKAAAAGVGGLQIDLGAVARGIEMLAGAMDPDEMVAFVIELLSTTKMKKDNAWVDITPEIFDIEFAGKMHVVYQLLGFVVGVNYGSFFAEGGIGASILSKTGMGAAVPPGT